MIETFLDAADGTRVSMTLDKVARYGLRDCALTGGLALELHLISRQKGRGFRALTDVDLVVQSFGSIPDSVAQGFLFHHIHPRATEGRTLMQLIDPDNALRVDLFGACGATLARSASMPVIRGGSMQVVSLEDLVVRKVTLLLGVERDKEVEAKHAQHFEELVATVDVERVEIAWREHRRVTDPGTFGEGVARVRELLRLYPDLLVPSQYSAEPTTCSSCESRGPFRSAPPATVVSILGYC